MATLRCDRRYPARYVREHEHVRAGSLPGVSGLCEEMYEVGNACLVLERDSPPRSIAAAGLHTFEGERLAANELHDPAFTIANLGHHLR